ncbi:DsbA family protein [Patescibacteria group bacterium]
MFCLAGLIIFGLLGIFSATHKQLAKDAAHCVFRRATFRKCTIGFKEKFKGIILSRLINRSERIARAFNKHFELFSWIFVILTIVSILWIGKGVYNFYIYGSCSGLNKSNFCVFDPTGENNKTSLIDETCTIDPPSEASLTADPLTIEDYPTKNLNASNKIVFIGCYNCKYTKKSYPIIKELLEKYSVQFTFIHFPVKTETDYLTGYGACIYKESQEKFWEFNERLFGAESEKMSDKDFVRGLMHSLGIDDKKIEECAKDEGLQEKILDQYEDIKQTGIYGTPTIFINGKAFVGPKPTRVYKRALRK